ncbi:MAG: DUF4912 domain-containing protein [Sphaerochaetaceae bacterium]|nr:DUF4912 domain-containing protein [Sphaerochaetaceae bacterium]
MVLLNIDALSTSELQYIASQENIDDWEELSREELIDSINELYDGMSEDPNKGTHRFLNCLSDVQYTKLMNLPGVEALPDEYLETSIHMIMKDPFWAYVFWSISPNAKSECIDRDSDYRIFIRTNAFDSAGKRIETYDINVGQGDRSWTVALPRMDTTYQMDMVAEYPKDKVFEVLASSEKISTPPAIDPTVIESIRGTAQASLIISSISTKTGEMMNNKVVSDLFSKLNSGSNREGA